MTQTTTSELPVADLVEDARRFREIAASGGCSDGWCVITGKAKGQHTNGGCRCCSRPDDDQLRRIERLLRVAQGMIARIEAAAGGSHTLQQSLTAAADAVEAHTATPTLEKAAKVLLANAPHPIFKYPKQITAGEIGYPVVTVNEIEGGVAVQVTIGWKVTEDIFRSALGIDAGHD